MPTKKIDNSWSWTRFGYGCAGAAVVELVRIRKILSSGDPHQAFQNIFLLVSLAMIVLGGVLANAWGDNKPMKCIYAGASFPVWISGWAHVQLHD